MIRERIPLNTTDSLDSVSYIFQWFYIILIRLCQNKWILSTILKCLNLNEIMCLKKLLQLAIHVFLFIPLYLVLNCSMNIDSLVFLNWGSLLKTFSRMVTSISEMAWPGRLKCSPVVTYCYLLLPVVTYCYLLLHIVTYCYLLLPIATYCDLLLPIVEYCYL